MTREKFYHLMDLVEQANKAWPTVQAEVSYGRSCTVHVYDSRKGDENYSESYYWTDDPWQSHCIDGELNGGRKTNNGFIITYYDVTFERAERYLQQIIDEYEPEVE